MKRRKTRHQSHIFSAIINLIGPMYTSYYANKQQAVAGKEINPSLQERGEDGSHLRPNVPRFVGANCLYEHKLLSRNPNDGRRTVDYMSPTVKMIQERSFIRGVMDAKGLQPTAAGALDVRCAINVVLWTPEGRRCMTGTASGEFTLWSGTTFNFESILQAHEFGVRAMRFSHNEHYLVSGDDNGRIKYWKPNLELLNDAVAHREAVRGICFSPTDLKFCTCSDDATLRIWDFGTVKVDKVMSGHGADAKFVDWHPSKALIASCSKDTQVKLWSAKEGNCVSTLYGHKAGISQIWWNRNGNWLLSAGRDQVCKLFDVRMMKEFANFRGHSREVTCCEWHPVHEELFVSGASDGSLIYWLASRHEAQAKIMNAHDTAIWSLSWHPLGHLLATGSSDYVTKFWCRQRSGDIWRDRHLQDMEEGSARDSESFGKIPGVGVGAEAPAMIPGIEDAAKKGMGAHMLPSLPFSSLRNTTTPRPPPGPPPGHHVLSRHQHQERKAAWAGHSSSPHDSFPKRSRSEATTHGHDFKRTRNAAGSTSGAKWGNPLKDQGTSNTQFKDLPEEANWGGYTDDFDEGVMVGSITRRFSSNVGTGEEGDQDQGPGHNQGEEWVRRSDKEGSTGGGRWERGGWTGSSGRLHGFAGLHGKGRGTWNA